MRRRITKWTEAQVFKIVDAADGYDGTRQQFCDDEGISVGTFYRMQSYVRAARAGQPTDGVNMIRPVQYVARPRSVPAPAPALAPEPAQAHQAVASLAIGKDRYVQALERENGTLRRLLSQQWGMASAV